MPANPALNPYGAGLSTKELSDLTFTIAGILDREAGRAGQGRFLLFRSPSLPRAQAFRKAAKKILVENFSSDGFFPLPPGPWDRKRILAKRFALPPASSPSGSLRLQVEFRIYLELLLPPLHPSSGVWTGIGPASREWGSLPTIRSSGERKAKRERKSGPRGGGKWVAG